jgi:hypothetical protein
MSKKLTDLIAEEETKRKQQGIGVKNRVLFLALREDIKDAMKDGWALKQIYRTLYTQKNITFSYQTFVNYANELILKPKQSLVIIKQETRSKNPQQEQTAHTTEVIPKKSHELAGFTFNPIAKREDLI